VGLGGGDHHLRAGTYRLDTPVAIGASGVAQAAEGVTFGADERSLLRATGDAALALDAIGARRFTGSGGLRLDGALRVTDGPSTRTASSVELSEGSFDLTLTPGADGTWTVSLAVQGEVTAT
jgi:hypothetical protein